MSDIYFFGIVLILYFLFFRIGLNYVIKRVILFDFKSSKLLILWGYVFTLKISMLRIMVCVVDFFLLSFFDKVLSKLLNRCWSFCLYNFIVRFILNCKLFDCLLLFIIEELRNFKKVWYKLFKRLNLGRLNVSFKKSLMMILYY